MKETNPDWFKHAYVHAETSQQAEDVFGTKFLPKTARYEVTESSLIEELVHILDKNITCDTFTESVDGIDTELAQELISRVLDIVGDKT